MRLLLRACNAGCSSPRKTNPSTSGCSSSKNSAASSQSAGPCARPAMAASSGVGALLPPGASTRVSKSRAAPKPVSSASRGGVPPGPRGKAAPSRRKRARNARPVSSAPALQPARAAQGAPLPSVSASSAPRASAASRLKAASSARGRGQGGASVWAVSRVRGVVMRAIVLRRPGQGVPFFIILVYWAHRRGSIVWPNALAWNASTVLKPSWVRIPPSPLCARGQGVTCR